MAARQVTRRSRRKKRALPRMPLFIGGFLGGVLVGGWLFWQTGTVSLPQVTLTLGGVLLGIILAMFITVAVIKARRPKPASEQTPER